MPCPYFLPLRRLDRGAWVSPPRLPLGDPYAGECQADPAAPHQPPESHQRERCNCGYARGHCSHFPPAAPTDAVRFSILSDSGARIELIYVLEKDHAPVQHGRLVYIAAEDRWEDPPVGELLARQAQAFLESHRIRVS
jgi:hypothetical protein